MTTGITIYRRDGTVAFVADEATTMREAVEQAAKSRANLYGAILYGADLSYAALSGAALYGADLYGADLYDADLYDADLYDADLTGANLTGANLIGANLTGANLTGANLTGANLTGTNLTGANLTGAVGVHYATIGPVDGWMVALTLTDDSLKISAGCRYFTLPEAREHWSDSSRWTKGAAPEHGARMLAAVDALMALAVDWPEKLPEVTP
ncbi:MAG: pentapeptide repeat-containing protein [Candidatus Nanopelagicales bacterium]